MKPRGTRRDFLRGTAGAAGFAFLGAPVPGPGVSVDFSTSRGRLKALHGVVNGPRDGDGLTDVSVFHKEAAFPIIHLNACHWPNPDVLDIHHLFPLFHADPEDPKNYTFRRSDTYMKSVIDTEAGVVLRLGESIEHGTSWNVSPPEDFKKWARICVNIIRHYNEGWADGFAYDIRYWQIWNEPENDEQWHGTLRQYLELYEAAAKAIKAHDPSLKVGGPAATHVGSRWVRPFLEYGRDRNLPLDFFSWHCYTTSPKGLAGMATQARTLLDEYGFGKTESQLSEWHYLKYGWNLIHTRDPAAYPDVRARFGEMSGPEGAAYGASVLLLLQDAPVDMACFYTADTMRYGLFDEFGVPRKIYHSLRAFNELLKTPHRVDCPGAPMDDTFALCAGLSGDRKTAGLLVSHFKSPATAITIALKNVPWAGPTHAEILRLDTGHDLAKTAEETLDPGSAGLTLDLPAGTVAFIRLAPA